MRPVNASPALNSGLSAGGGKRFPPPLASPWMRLESFSSSLRKKPWVAMWSTSGGLVISLSCCSSADWSVKMDVFLSFSSETTLITSPSFSAPGRGSKFSPRKPEPILAPWATLRDLFRETSRAWGLSSNFLESKSGPARINISPLTGSTRLTARSREELMIRRS